MAEFDNQVLRSRAQAGVGDAAIDQGLRSFLLGTYNYMTLGLAITGLTAYGAYASGLFGALVSSPLIWVVMLAPLAMVFFLSFRIHTLSPATAQVLFYVYSAMVGLSLAGIFAIYVGADIVRVFFITAASFAALSLYGYTTKRDLTALGSFLIIGVFGLIIAMIVNFFMASSALDFAISVIGVGIFAGLTAYDTQKLKEMYYVTAGDGVAAARASIMGALRLYLDFLNMFLFLLRLLGNRE
jgi:uncharacterized protein